MTYNVVTTIGPQGLHSSAVGAEQQHISSPARGALLSTPSTNGHAAPYSQQTLARAGADIMKANDANKKRVVKKFIVTDISEVAMIVA
jgi:hypothetical protein